MPDYRLGKLKGRFVVTWNGTDGRRHRWRLNATTPADARSEIRDFERQVNQQSVASRITVQEIWNAYIKEKEAQGKVAVPRMRECWVALRGAFSRETPAGITPGLVRDYTTHRRGTAGDGTIYTELGYLRAALRHAGFKTPIELPPKPRPRNRYLTPEEARKLIDAAQMPHVRLFILLALCTAGRPSSILDLEWGRVDFDRGRITLDNPGRDRTAQGRATVPIQSDLVEPLKVAKEAALSAYVIEWAGGPVKSIKRGFREACRRAGLEEVTPYVLRKTAARFMVEAGVPMAQVAQMMGHTSTSITEKYYGRFSPEHLRSASDAISAALYGREK